MLEYLPEFLAGMLGGATVFLVIVAIVRYIWEYKQVRTP